MLLCEHPPQVSYLPWFFGGPPSCQGQGPAPLVEAPRTPFSDRLYSVMSQSLADITSAAPARGRGTSGSRCGQAATLLRRGTLRGCPAPGHTADLVLGTHLTWDPGCVTPRPAGISGHACPSRARPTSISRGLNDL